MAKGCTDGYLVKRTIKDKDGKESVCNLGVAMDEYNAKTLIEEQCGYYNDCAFEYSRTVLEDGIRFMDVKNESDVVFVKFTYERCVIVTGV